MSKRLLLCTASSIFVFAILVVSLLNATPYGFRRYESPFFNHWGGRDISIAYGLPDNEIRLDIIGAYRGIVEGAIQKTASFLYICNTQSRLSASKISGGFPVFVHINFKSFSIWTTHNVGVFTWRLQINIICNPPFPTAY